MPKAPTDAIGAPLLYLQVALQPLGGQRLGGIVFRGRLELLEVVKPGLLVDPIRDDDDPRDVLGIGVEMLADRVGRDVDDVTRFPLEAALELLREPGVLLAAFDREIAVDVDVIATAFEDVDSL